MSDGRWFEIDADVAAAIEHFARAVDLFRVGGFAADGLEGYRVRMAFMHAMQSGHTSLETALGRVLDLLGESAPTGQNWHADLIRRLSHRFEARPALLSGDLAAAADETRRFRHVAMRNYGSFDVSRAAPALHAAGLLATSLTDAFARFRQALDAD